MKSGAGIGVEATDLSMTTQSLLFLFQVADFAVLSKSTAVESLRERAICYKCSGKPGNDRDKLQVWGLKVALPVRTHLGMGVMGKD